MEDGGAAMRSISMEDGGAAATQSAGDGRAGGAVHAHVQAVSLAAARCGGNVSASLQRALAVKQYKLRVWADKFAPQPEDDQFLGFMEEPPNPWITQEDALEHLTDADEGAGDLVASAKRAAARHCGSPSDTPGQWLARLRRSEQKEVAGLLHRQANEKRSVGDNDGARELYCWVHESVACTLKGLASVEVELGDAENAVALYMEALAIEKRIYGESSEVAIHTLCRMADAVVALGMYDKALSLYEEGHAICKDAFGINHSIAAKCTVGIASIHRLRGEYQAALELFVQAAQTETLSHGPASAELANALRGQGGALRGLGRNADALSVLQHARSILAETFSPDHIDILRTDDEVAQVLINLAAVHRACGRPQEALDCLQQAVPLRERLLGSDAPPMATLLSNLASAYAGVGKHAAALKIYERVLVIKKAAFGVHSDAVKAVSQEMVEMQKVLWAAEHGD